MKTKFFAFILSITPGMAAADPGFEFSFGAGGGGKVAPGYFGSDTYVAGATGGFDFGHLKLGGFEIGDPDPNAQKMGLSPRGSFRVIGARSSSDFAELTGLDDIEQSIEVGGGITYRTSSFVAFADVRYGVIGHEGWVADLGADVVLRPAQDLTVTLGPRILWGSDAYSNTYFGVTPAEAAASAFTPYAPGAGLVSAGLEVGASYEISPGWSLEGTVGWERLTGAAATSPIVQARDGFKASLVVMRRFSIGR